MISKTNKVIFLVPALLSISLVAKAGPTPEHAAKLACSVGVSDHNTGASISQFENPVFAQQEEYPETFHTLPGNSFGIDLDQYNNKRKKLDESVNPSFLITLQNNIDKSIKLNLTFSPYVRGDSVPARRRFNGFKVSAKVSNKNQTIDESDSVLYFAPSDHLPPSVTTRVHTWELRFTTNIHESPSKEKIWIDCIILSSAHQSKSGKEYKGYNY